MAGTVKGLIVEIGGDTSGLQKALRGINSATSSLSKELRGINSLLKLDPSNTELVAQKQTVLSKNIQDTTTKLKMLKKAQEEADDAILNGCEISEENYRSLQREIINTENKLKQLQLQASKWTTAGDELQEFGTKVENISNKIDNLGSTLTTSLTLPVLAIGTAAVTTGNDFEAQMSRVQAIAGATKDELEQLTDQAIQLGADTTFSATQVAEGMENLASAGFTTQEIMQAMPGLLNLAASSGADLATSSEIAASAIRGFGLEASTSAHVADVFAEAAARTNAQTEDMGNAMKYVAPVAKTVGLSIEETAAAIGIMSDAGIKGEQAGTTLRSGLVRLVKPTAMVKEAMKQLDVEFYNSDGTMKSLTEIIATLQEHTAGLTDEVKNQALAQIFGTEALSGMLALVNRGSGELSDMTKSFEECDGAAEEMADTMLDNTKGAFESLSGSLESAGIAIQKALAPEIKDLAKKIQDLVDDFNDLSDEEKQSIINKALLVAAIGPAIKILGTLGKGIGTVSKGLGTLSTAIGVFKTGAQSANTTANSLAKGFTALTSPAGLLAITISGITLAATAMYSEMNKTGEAVSKSSKEIENAKNQYNSFKEEQNKVLNATISEIDNTQKLANELKTLVDENGNVKEGYKDRVSYILNELNNALGTEYSMTGNVIDQYKELSSTIEELLLKEKANAILENEEAKRNEAIEKRDEAYNNILEKTKELSDAQKELNDRQKEYDDFANSYAGSIAPAAVNNMKALIEQQEKVVQEAQKNLDNSKDIYNGYLDDIATYENDYAIVASGNNEKIQEMIRNRTYTYQQSSADIGEAVNHNIQQVMYEMQQYQTAYQNDLANNNTYNAEKNRIQLEAGQKQLETLAQQLVAMTSTTQEMTPQQLEAWKSLASGSFATYSEYVSKLAPEMQAKIQEATGVVVANTPEFAKRAGEMGQKVAEEFDKDNTAKESALNNLQGFYEGLTDEEKKQFLIETVGERADEVAKEFENGDYETSGKNVLEGLYNGLNNGTLGKNLIDKAAGIAKSIARQFNIQWDEHSPSKLMKKMAENFLIPISTVFQKRQKGLDRQAKNLAQGISQNFKNSFGFNEKYNIPNIKSLNKEIKNQLQTIFTTPQITFNVQKMDETNLQTCFNYINKKFGSRY